MVGVELPGQGGAAVEGGVAGGEALLVGGEEGGFVEARPRLCLPAAAGRVALRGEGFDGVEVGDEAEGLRAVGGREPGGDGGARAVDRTIASAATTDNRVLPGCCGLSPSPRR